MTAMLFEFGALHNSTVESPNTLGTQPFVLCTSFGGCFNVIVINLDSPLLTSLSISEKFHVFTFHHVHILLQMRFVVNRFRMVCLYQSHVNWDMELNMSCQTFMMEEDNL